MYFAKIENIEAKMDGNYHVTCKCPSCNKSTKIIYKEPEMVAFETAYEEGEPLAPSLINAGVGMARREFLISGMCFDCIEKYYGIEIDPKEKEYVIE